MLRASVAGRDLFVDEDGAVIGRRERRDDPGRPRARLEEPRCLAPHGDGLGTRRPGLEQRHLRGRCARSTVSRSPRRSRCASAIRTPDHSSSSNRHSKRHWHRRSSRCSRPCIASTLAAGTLSEIYRPETTVVRIGRGARQRPRRRRPPRLAPPRRAPRGDEPHGGDRRPRQPQRHLRQRSASSAAPQVSELDVVGIGHHRSALRRRRARGVRRHR